MTSKVCIELSGFSSSTDLHSMRNRWYEWDMSGKHGEDASVRQRCRTLLSTASMWEAWDISSTSLRTYLNVDGITLVIAVLI